MTLSEPQKKYLRGLGHALKPLIMVGDAGLSESLLVEFESTLAHHELIKVRVRVGDRKARDTIINEMCDKSGASLLCISNVASSHATISVALSVTLWIVAWFVPGISTMRTAVRSAKSPTVVPGGSSPAT